MPATPVSRPVLDPERATEEREATHDGRHQRSSPADERALRAAIEACARDFPAVTHERVDDLVRTLYERTAGAKVHQYRVLLAERDARARLRAEERDRASAGRDHLAVQGLSTGSADAPARDPHDPPGAGRVGQPDHRAPRLQLVDEAARGRA